MKILSIDIGKTMGVTIWYKEEFIKKEEYKQERLCDLYKYVSKLARNVDLILIPYPTRFYRVMLAHAKLMGVIEMVAEECGITAIEVQDATCKKVVLGSGKAKKEEIKNHFKEKSEHIADSMMFTEWYLRSINSI